MTREDANLDYVNYCLERGVTDFTEIDLAFDLFLELYDKLAKQSNEEDKE